MSFVNHEALPCDVVAACGGCPRMHLSQYEIQVVEKKRAIESVGRKLGYVSDVQMSAAPNPLDYRRRIRLQVRQGRVSFFNQQKSKTCAVLTPGLLQLVNRLFDLSRSEPSLFADATHLDARDRDSDGMFGLTVFPTFRDLAALQTRLTDVYFSFGGNPKPPMQRLPLLDGLTHYAPVSSFMQINEQVNRQILQTIMDACAAQPPQTFWDLYCGVGNLSLMLARHGIAGGGEELNASSVMAANRTLNEWGLPSRYIIGDARQLSAQRPPSVDLLIANPPRAGLRDGVKLVNSMRPERLILMSCALPSLTEDLSALIGLGYVLGRLQGFDMFPHTDHVEIIATLSRS